MSFLNDCYLGELYNAECTVAPTLDGLRPVTRSTGPTEEQLRATAELNRPVTDIDAGQDTHAARVTLPGGISMPKETFYLLLALVVVFAVYYFSSKTKESAS